MLPRPTARQRATRRCAAVAVLVALTALASPAAALASAPAATPAATPDATVVGTTPAAPAQPVVGDRVSEQQAAVAEQEAAAAQAGERLATLAEQAARALEAYQAALRVRDEALIAHDEQVRRWQGAQAQLADSEDEMARWTSQAYRHGVAAAGVAGFVAVVDAKSPDDLQQRVTVLRQVGRVEARELEGAAQAEAGQAAATAAAEEATRAALDAAARAEEAKVASDSAVAEQRTQVAALEALLAGSRTAADDAVTAAAAVAMAQLRSSGAAALAGCSGDDLSGFANGLVPEAALCALPGAGGHRLRGDAAAAFVELDSAYRAEFGTSVCVTDSYRDLAAQVAVRAAKPGLAAVPGTSNHGWGVALDLCGGIQTFGSPQHAWMRLNAPLHGWFHPAWAQAGGSKPEAWHWEFAG